MSRLGAGRRRPWSAVAAGAALLVAACGDRGGGAETPLAADVELALGPGSMAPNLARLADGRIVLTWHEPAAAERSALRLALRSADGWSEPVTVRQSDRFFVNWADLPSFVEMADGTWAVQWLEKVADATYAYHVRVALSSDGGRSWSEPVTPHRDDTPTEHGFVSMVPWDAEEAALVWLDGRAMTGEEGEMSLRFTTLRSDGTRGEERQVDGRTCECCQTSLARTARGLLAAYRDRGPDEVRDVAVARWEYGTWTEPVPVARDGWRIAGCPVNGPQADAAGDVAVVAWFSGADGRPVVRAAFTEDGGATFGTPIRVDGGRPVGRVDAALLADGTAAVAWIEALEDEAAVLLRRVGPAGPLGEAVRVSRTAADRASGFPRLARAGEELLVAWTRPGPDGGVRVAVTGPGGD